MTSRRLCACLGVVVITGALVGGGYALLRIGELLDLTDDWS